VRDAETVARHGVDEGALQFLARREGYRMHHDVDAVPALTQRRKRGRDLRVLGHVHRQRDVAAALGGEFLDPLAQLVILVGEGEFGALPVHGLGDAGGDRAVARNTHHKCAFSSQKSHRAPPDLRQK
jgi:hypothetical protein